MILYQQTGLKFFSITLLTLGQWCPSASKVILKDIKLWRIHTNNEITENTMDCKYSYMHQWTGGRFKKAYELLNLRALKFSPLNKIHIFECMGKIFCVEFQRYPLNSTQNILPIHWKVRFLYNIEILRALRFKSSYAFLKGPPGPSLVQVMACACSMPSHYLNQCWLIINWIPGKIFQWNLNMNSIIFNAIENGGHFVQGEMS